MLVRPWNLFGRPKLVYLTAKQFLELKTCVPVVHVVELTLHRGYAVSNSFFLGY